ncbi:MAG: hypothetical protein ABEL51_00735 [Salinibacter sp.]
MQFTRSTEAFYRWTPLLLVALLTGLAAPPGAAQDVQVPLDRDSTVYVLDAALRQKLGLFPEVTGFQEARLYRKDGAGYELVIRYKQNGRVLRERRSLTSSDVEDLRARITRRTAGSTQLSPGLEDGRYGLIAATTFHGLVEGGLLAGTFSSDGDGAATLTLLGGTMGFFVPLLATRNTPVSEAEADMVFYGGLQGYAHAVQVMGVLAGENLPGRGTAGLAAAGGALEGTIWRRVAQRNDWTGGHAEMVSLNGLGGNLVGLAIGGAIVGEEPNFEGSSRIVAGTSLLGSVGGAYLGHRMGRTNRYTDGDARIYAQSALQGANLMGSFLSVQDDASVRGTALLLSGSAVGGAVLGNYLVRDRDFTGTQGSLVALGSFAGSLLGLAVTTGGEGNGEATEIAQALGSAAGFGITYAVLEGEARRQVDGRSSAINLNFKVGPAMAHTAGRAGTERHVVPRVTLRASF